MIKKGFTLIELLIVIVIIGIILAVSIFGIQGSFEAARDTQRKSDIKQYQSALEGYANQKNSLYPSRNFVSGKSASTTLCTDMNVVLEPDIKCPEDPKYTADPSFMYLYQSDGSGSGTVDATTYVLWAKLENATSGTYWVACSNGRTGTTSVGIPPTSGACPI